jgi:hypothetical protein
MGADLDERWRPPVEVRPAIRHVCERLLPVIRSAAQQHGYAIAAHGSFERDLDVVACPWTDVASDSVAMVRAVQAALTEELGFEVVRSGEVGQKPHGRQVWTLIILDYHHEVTVRSSAGSHPFIDLSVMPRQA